MSAEALEKLMLNLCGQHGHGSKEARKQSNHQVGYAPVVL